MKFIIGVDLEGVACVVGEPGGSLNTARDLEFAKRQATREADAAAGALLDSGAERVIVWDNHSASLNLDYDALDPRCEIAVGVGFSHRWPGLDSTFTGVLFIGYHSKDNSSDAPLCHTYSSRTHQWIKINGQEVGELAIDAAVAGELGVPPLFVASDDKAVAEAKQFFPGIATVTTKKGYGWNAAVSKHPRRSAEEIREAVKALAGLDHRSPPFSFDSPMEIEIRYKRIEDAQARSRIHPDWKATDPYTARRCVQRITDLY